MAYQCPHCQGPVQRGGQGAAGKGFGAVGALLDAAFGGFHCPACGPIPKQQFAPEIRKQMTQGSLLLAAGALALVAVVVWLLGAF